MMVTLAVGRRLRRARALAFWLERRFNRAEPGPKTFQHGLDNLVCPDAQRGFGDFNRQMPIANMPGEARQTRRIMRRCFNQLFRQSFDGDQPSILKFQRITIPKVLGLRQIEQKLQAADPAHVKPATVAVLEIQEHAIGNWPPPGTAPMHKPGMGKAGVRAWHGRLPMVRVAAKRLSQMNSLAGIRCQHNREARQMASPPENVGLQKWNCPGLMNEEILMTTSRYAKPQILGGLNPSSQGKSVPSAASTGNIVVVGRCHFARHWDKVLFGITGLRQCNEGSLTVCISSRLSDGPANATSA